MNRKTQFDHLYFGQVDHDTVVALFPVPAHVRETTTDENDFSTTIFLLAPSLKDAKEMLREKYKADVPVTLVPSGVASMSFAWGSEVNIQTGVRGTLNWDELEKCPECHSKDLRHDHSTGETDCVSCGWSMSWTA